MYCYKPPELVDNTMNWSPEPYNNVVILTWYGEAINDSIAKCQKKMSKLKSVKTITDLLLYVLDVGTDINAAVQHFYRGNIWWGALTVLFTILPMLIASIISIIVAIKDCGESVCKKFFRALAAIISSPTMPIGILVWNIVASIRKKCHSLEKDSGGDDNSGRKDIIKYNSDEGSNNSDNHNSGSSGDEHSDGDDDGGNNHRSGGNRYDSNSNNHTSDSAGIAGFIKLCETLMESYPQALMQTYIVFITEGPIEAWQWLTIAISLTTLAYSISFSILFDRTSTSNKCILFIFGLLAISSRIMVSCVFSMKHKLLLFVPIGTEFAISLLLYVLAYFSCVSLDEYKLDNGINNIVAIIFSWVLTAVYNCFTQSGLIISIINLAFAMIGFIVPETISIIAFTLTLISCIANIIFITIPYFKSVRENWIDIKDSGKNWPVNKVMTKCHQTYSQRFSVAFIWAKLLGLWIYVMDVTTDIYAGIQYFYMGHYWWGALTILFTILPPVFSSFTIIPIINNVFEISKESVWSKCLWMLGAIFCSPVMTFGALVWNVIASLRGYDPDADEDPVGAAALKMKFLEAILESFPQTCLQIYICFQKLNHGDDIGLFLWLGIATSLISLAFTISLNRFLFTDNIISSRVMFFIFGLLCITSRLLVGCVFSLTQKLLWFVPISTMLIVSIIIWGFKRCFGCSRFNVQLAKDLHNSSNINAIVLVIGTWVLTAAYNCFTMSGLMLSAINLALAVWGFFLVDDRYLAVVITTVTLSAISCAANVMFRFFPRFKHVGYHWLSVNDDNESKLY